jgi:hypothetical protein
VKIRSVEANNRRHAFAIVTRRGCFAMPYATLAPSPSRADPVAAVYVDDELGGEGFTYVLRSGAEGSVHIDAVLEQNEDPAHLRDLLVYKLTLEARACVENSPLSRREIIRRMGTSPAQFYRLLDVTNRRKTIDKLLVLLAVVGCDVDFTVNTDAGRGGAPR